MVCRIARVCQVLGLALLTATSAVAQGFSPKLSGNFGVFHTNLNTEEPEGIRRLAGFTMGGFTSVSHNRFSVELGYLEGSLSPSGQGIERDIVEGELLLTVRTFRWMSVQLGPHIRSFVRPDGTERWIFWEGRLRAGTQLGTPRLLSRFEIWQVLAANVDAAEPYDGGRGISGALWWDISSLPFWLGLGYRIDRSHLGRGSRTEVLEHVLISVGFGRNTAN